jgi:hypothetical protein
MPYIVWNTTTSKTTKQEKQSMLPIFIIDSGASLPMCYQLQFFTSLVPDSTPVKLDDGKIIYAKGKGTVSNLHDVYYVPDLYIHIELALPPRSAFFTFGHH